MALIRKWLKIVRLAKMTKNLNVHIFSKLMKQSRLEGDQNNPNLNVNPRGQIGLN